jgi:predicted nucleic acid-binding protein
MLSSTQPSAICIDASLVIPLVIMPRRTAIHRLWRRWDREERERIAPSLLHYEVTNALYQYERHGTYSVSVIRRALRLALALPLHLYAESWLHERALDLAGQYTLPASYDAHYLAIAEHCGVELWTGDRRLAQAVQSSLPWVHFVAP